MSEKQKKTVIHQLIEKLKEKELSNKEMIKLLEDSLRMERSQMEEMFEEGVYFGKNPVNIDYPFSRCVGFLYERYSS